MSPLRTIGRIGQPSAKPRRSFGTIEVQVEKPRPTRTIRISAPKTLSRKEQS